MLPYINFWGTREYFGIHKRCHILLFGGRVNILENPSNDLSEFLVDARAYYSKFNLPKRKCIMQNEHATGEVHV
jgi:hypothetical protein